MGSVIGLYDTWRLRGLRVLITDCRLSDVYTDLECLGLIPEELLLGRARGICRTLWLPYTNVFPISNVALLTRIGQEVG